MDSTLRIFLSYSHIDRHIAGNIKTALENIGLSVFLAHEDIKPSLEWQETICRKLKECDIFIPIISDNFKNSKWTDQESGIAYGFEKIVIPISLNLAPYGFIGKYQALKFKEDITDTCQRVIEAIMEKPVSNRMKNVMITSFVESESFVTANHRIKFLKLFAPFSELQLNDIVFGFISNHQITGSWNSRRFVNEVMTNQPDNIHPLLRYCYKKTIENESYFTREPKYIISENIYEFIYLNILRGRPDIDLGLLELLVEEEMQRNNSLSQINAILQIFDRYELRDQPIS